MSIREELLSRPFDEMLLMLKKLPSVKPEKLFAAIAAVVVTEKRFTEVVG